MAKERDQRKPFEITRDRVTIAQLRLQGLSQYSIANKLNVSRDVVRYDLAAIEAEWKKSALIDFDGAKAQELARIDNLERTYWDAWERSMRGRSKTIQRQTSRTGKKGKAALTTASVEKQELYGDPRFLDGIKWCVEQRCKIFGLYAVSDNAGKAPGVPAGNLAAVVYLPAFGTPRQAPQAQPPPQVVAPSGNRN